MVLRTKLNRLNDIGLRLGDIWWSSCLNESRIVCLFKTLHDCTWIVQPIKLIVLKQGQIWHETAFFKYDEAINNLTLERCRSLLVQSLKGICRHQKCENFGQCVLREQVVTPKFWSFVMICGFFRDLFSYTSWYISYIRYIYIWDRGKICAPWGCCFSNLLG